MIGWNPGDGGSVTYPPPARDSSGGVPDPWAEAPGQESAPEQELGFWTWVEVEAETVFPVVWTRWATSEDERVCPECGPLDGAVWTEDDGPTPPLHVNCCCGRVYAFTEWQTRASTTWEQLWIDG